jgi:hypothetical protein
MRTSNGMSSQSFPKASRLCPCNTTFDARRQMLIPSRGVRFVEAVHLKETEMQKMSALLLTLVLATVSDCEREPTAGDNCGRCR